MQLLREFRQLTGFSGKANSLMDSWPTWEAKIIKFARIESQTRRIIKDLLDDLEKNEDESIVDIPGKLQ